MLTQLSFTHTGTHTHTGAHAHTRTLMHTRTHTHRHTHAHAHACTYTHTHCYYNNTHFFSDQPHKETVMQSVISPTVIPATMLMSIVPFPVTVTPAHTTLKCIRQSTDALSVGLFVHAGLMRVNTSR